MKRIAAALLLIAGLIALIAPPTLAQTITMPSGGGFTGGPYSMGGQLSIGVGGTTLTNGIVKFTSTLTPSAVGSTCAGAGNGVGCAVSQTFTISGLSTSDTIFVNGPATTLGPPSCPVVAARVSSANTLQLDFWVASATCTPVAGPYNIFAIR